MTEHSKNVLDLRQLTDQRVKRKKTVLRDMAKSVALTRGRPVFVFDRSRIKRELLKYSVAILALIFIATSVALISTTSQHIHRASAAAKNGLTNIETGLNALNNNQQAQASQAFNSGQNELAAAEKEIELAVSGLQSMVKYLPYIGRRYKAAVVLIGAAKKADQAGLEASTIKSSLTESTGLVIENNGVIRGSLGWLATLSSDQTKMHRITDLLVESYRAVADTAASDLPKNMQATFTAWQTVGRGLFGTPERLADILKVVLGISSQTDEQNYLVMFQNNDELRPTGGFMGTYMLIKFHRGTFAITDAPGNGPYALKDQIEKNIRPPVPLDTITPAMMLEDANWYPDARVSAQAIAEIYRRARGFKPDGVIFVTPDIVERLLSITGPIHIDATDTTVSADNFITVTENQVENNYDKSLNAPKEVVIQLLPTLLAKLSKLSLADGLKALAMAMDEADRGNIIFTSENNQIASASNKLNWDGAINFGSADGLIVNAANVNSGKTDRSIKSKISVKINPSTGDWTHEVTITRTHTNTSGDTLRGIDNTEYIRVIVPAGANLVSIKGETIPPASMFINPPVDSQPLTLSLLKEDVTFVDPVNKTTLTHSDNSTTFGFWSTIKPGASTTIVLTYTVPAARTSNNGLWIFKWQRQPGILNQDWELIMSASGGNYKPTIPLSDWSAQSKNWIWKGNSDRSTLFSGSVKLDK